MQDIPVFQIEVFKVYGDELRAEKLKVVTHADHLAHVESQQAELERLKVTEFLIPEFLEAMADIGRYGFRKYGDQSFQARRLAGDNSRGPLERCKAENVCQHAKDHLNEYRQRTTHDHFGTLGHQLAAAAFNAMMEFYFSRAALNPPAAEGGDGK